MAPAARPRPVRAPWALALAVIAALALAPARADRVEEEIKASKAFCDSYVKPGKLQCGFASDDEVGSTSRRCPYCGTAFFGLPEKLPRVLQSHPSYSQYSTGVVSLACKGRVVVRAVFRLVAQPDTGGRNCSYARLEAIDTRPGDSAVVRCELELPAGAGSEAERALRAKERRCWTCTTCGDGGGCPARVGVWYSDAFTTTARGCELDPKLGLETHRAGIIVNPGTRVEVAKLEACNSASCFSAAYEASKAASAKKCVAGKCPP